MISSINIRSLLLRTEEDAKLSRILNKQRYHHDQLVRSSNQPIKIINRSHSLSGESYNLSNVSNSTISPERNHFPIAAWTNQHGKIVNIQGHRSSENQQLHIQDVSVEDCEVKSNISLLDSESVYLPFDGAKTPVTPKRPMTAPTLHQSETNYNTNAYFLTERPKTGLVESRTETKYEAYDRRPIKPLNQNLTKGSKSFDYSPPQRSGSEPAIGVKKETPPTAMSQDYDTSIDQNNSDQENMEVEAIPTGRLSLIKDIAGNRKAQVLSKQSNDSNKNKDLKRSSSLKTNIIVPKSQISYNAEKYINTRNSTASSKNSSVVSHKKPKDLKKTSTLFSTKDSGFLSRPSSEAILSRSSSMEENKAATSIQAFWKGHRTRQYDPQAVSVRKEMRARHAEEHIELLQSELEKQRKLHEEEKRLRGLQMEAIRSLWKEVQLLHQWKKKFGESPDENILSSSPDSNAATLTQTNYSNVSGLLSGISTVPHHQQQNYVSLQSQVLELKETVESLTSMQNSGSIGLPDFEEMDITSGLVITANFGEDSHSSLDTSLTSGKWSSIPHSLSPYPSEEEEQYFQQIPEFGVPTPPRGLRLYHHDENSLVLSWSKSKLLDTNGKPQNNKSILGYRIYVNEHCQAKVGCSKTKVLISGLSPNTIYKFYIKALSGLGESYESNIIMAKLAMTQSTTSLHSTESDSPESEKEVETTPNEHVVRKYNKRKIRKERSPRSPRSPRSQNTSQTSNSTKPPTPETRTVQSITEAALSMLTHPRLHTRRRTSSRENQSPDNTDSEKHLSTGSERSANISTTSNHTEDSSFTSPGRDSSLERKIINTEKVKSKFFQNISENNSTVSGIALSETFTIDKRDSFLHSQGKNPVSNKAQEVGELRRTPSSDLSPTEKVHKESPDNVKTHRRKRSKDLQNQYFSDARADGQEEGKFSEPSQLPASVPVIDGRKRHSSGSRPNSPMCETIDSNTSTERKRVPVADLLEKGFLNITKSTSQGAGEETSNPSHRKLPPSPKGKGQRSPSSGGSREDLSTSDRRRTASSGSEDLNVSSSSKNSVLSSAAKVLQKLQLFSKSHEKKLRKKSKEEEVGDGSKTAGSVRRVSDSDCEQYSDISGNVTTSQRAPAPSDSSGSHSDDSRPTKTHRTHRRTPSDQSGILSYTKNLDDRPAHSPIIMDGSTVKKQSSTSSSSSNVKRHSSFHSLLPPKHTDKSASGEDISKPSEDQNETPAKDMGKKSPRSPSPIAMLTKPAKLPSQQGKKGKFFNDLNS